MSNDPNKTTKFSDYCTNLGVKVIAQEDKIIVKPKKPEPINNKVSINSHTYEINIYNLLEDPLYHDKYCNNGQKQVIKHLRTGKYKIVKILDLHHYRQNEAILKLEAFINGNITPGNTCLKIIHGKGLNSIDGKAVLRSIVRRFLEYHPRLIAYTNAEEREGGDGTTLVKLKS